MVILKYLYLNHLNLRDISAIIHPSETSSKTGNKMLFCNIFEKCSPLLYDGVKRGTRMKVVLAQGHVRALCHRYSSLHLLLHARLPNS